MNIIVCFAFLCVLLSSCDTSAKVGLELSEKLRINLSDDPEQMGRIHNEILEFVFEYIEENNDGSPSNIYREKLLKEGIRQFLLNSFDLTVDEINAIDATMKDVRFERTDMERAREKFSTQLREYLNRLDKIILDYSDFAQLDSRILQLEELAKNELQGEDLFIFRASASVGRNSLHYWGLNNGYNYHKWQAIAKKSSPVYASMINIFSLLMEDRRRELFVPMPAGGWAWRFVSIAFSDASGVSLGARLGPWGSLAGCALGSALAAFPPYEVKEDIPNIYQGYKK